VPRPTGHVTPPEDSIELVIALIMGPHDDCPYSEAQLRSAWEVRREESLRHPRRPGTRPWAFWRLEIGEEPPEDDDEPIRLAELGLLRDDEIAAIAERANEGRPRIGTTAEHYGPNYRPDVRAVELHEAVKRALRARPGR
jgi:hypothetical protein